MNNDHFDTLNGVIAPQPWMQYRQLATKTELSVSKSYDTSGGGNKDELIHTVDVQWTNNTPILQWVYGLVTRGGAQVTLQARSRGYLQMLHGVDTLHTATPPGSYSMVEVSRFGCGMDIGKGGVLALGSSFAVHEVRQNSTTAPLMPQKSGWSAIAPGDTFFARVQLRFKTDFWENTSIDGGDQNTESLFVSGDTRIDLYGIPAITIPDPRPTPTVIGVEHSINNTFHTDVDVPPDTADGDTIIAIVCNQFGLASDIVPEQTGWTQVHGRDAGWEDAHLKVYIRPATDSEPESYTFGNGLLAESIAHLITIRDASLMLDDGWQFASSIRKFWWEQNVSHMAPSIDSNGQLLLCLSYIPHNPLQTGLHQTSPPNMTELSNVEGEMSICAVASLPDPPRPTNERAFTVNTNPIFAQRSITLTILVPGTQTL